MTRAKAHTLLDLARAGGDVDELQIVEALAATGDFGWHHGRAAIDFVPSSVEAQEATA